MIIIVLILSIYAFIKTIGYAIYEYQDNSNKIATVIIVILAFVSLIRSNSYYYY